MSNELEQKNNSTPRQAAHDSALAGIRILIARPREQGAALALQLQQQGAETLLLPTIEIRPEPDNSALRQCFLNLDQYQHIIAISAHAAQVGLQWVDQYWPQLPLAIHWYAVGHKTATMLNQEDIQVITSSTGNNSEALLNLPELTQLQNERVLILRGVGGRELLKQQLEQRGAVVDYAELYHRALPTYSDDELRRALVDFSPDILVTLSGETLHNLVMLSQNSNITLTNKVVLVPSERVAEQARSLGFNRIWIANELDGHSLAECIATHWK